MLGDASYTAFKRIMAKYCLTERNTKQSDTEKRPRKKKKIHYQVSGNDGEFDKPFKRLEAVHRRWWFFEPFFIKIIIINNNKLVNRWS